MPLPDNPIGPEDPGGPRLPYDDKQRGYENIDSKCPFITKLNSHLFTFDPVTWDPTSTRGAAKAPFTLKK